MLPHAALTAALLAAATPVLGGDECSVQIGPDERFEQGRDLVVQPGERLQRVTALRGRVIIRSGAVVDEAMALGGDLVLEPGARVNGSATSVGGNVELLGNSWVGENAMSFGGEVRRAKEAWVGGNAIGLALRVGEETLARTIGKKLSELGRCKVIQVRESEPQAAALGAPKAL
jgi:hypothetical protein